MVNRIQVLIMDFLPVMSLISVEPTALTLTLFLLILYILYMRYIHPLSAYPGPLLASLTNFWKAYWVYKLTLHEKLVELHLLYGPVVRIGPNHLHFWNSEAIAPIYKAGRTMGKTEFYHAFTAFNPNLFGGTNEDVRKAVHTGYWRVPQYVKYI